MDIYDGVASVAVIGYTNIVMGCIPDKIKEYSGTPVLVSIICGILYALQVRSPEMNKGIVDTLVVGLMVGIMAAGGYSGGKALANK